MKEEDIKNNPWKCPVYRDSYDFAGVQITTDTIKCLAGISAASFVVSGLAGSVIAEQSFKTALKTGAKASIGGPIVLGSWIVAAKCVGDLLFGQK
jgi:hypothetical protein